MKKILLLTMCIMTVVMLLPMGCHAQIPPTNSQVVLTWTAPVASGNWAGCTTSNPCSYVVSRAILTSGTICPATTGTNYTPLNSSTPTAALTYTDSSASGQTACYIAQTEQGSGSTLQVSGPSNTAGAFVVPANPLAPALVGNDVGDVRLPDIPLLNDIKPGKLVAKLSRQ